ncbi:MAG: YraN family protein [Dehalococcoidia bacterium]|nr:YraN family protein [Dehalococcoidia bacterium]
MVTARRDLGDFGERIAAHRLESQGMTVLERNVRVGRIEIDLVMRDRDEMVFVEVRTRRGAPGLAAESVDAAKLRRMWEAAAGYCEQHGIGLEAARIDVVAVDLDGRGVARSVEHFRGVEVPSDD